MMPETCVPTSTCSIGSTVPVAVTLFSISPRLITWVSYKVRGVPP